MKTYIFSATQNKRKRLIKVWRIKHNQPRYVGCEEVISASYKGDYATACEVINKHEGHKLTDCGYYLQSKNIKLTELMT